jgi:2,5-diketo-D-gluconate reductase A
MRTVPAVTLNTGIRMPVLGLGTWTMTNDEAAQSVRAAAALGYRLIDTAAMYGNEHGVGAGIRASGVAREDFFVCSKLHSRDHGYDRALRAFDVSLSELGIDYLDLYLIHWPMPMYGLYAETWRALCRLLVEGRARAVGVSNFTPAQLKVLADETGVLPSVNQIQLNPRVSQSMWRDWAAQHSIVVQSWSPLSQGGSLLAEPVITDIAAHYGKTPAQIVLRWHLDLNLVPIPKSTHPGRLMSNIDVFDFELTSADIQRISTLDETEEAVDPDTFEQE